MRKIQVLSDILASQVAAGEVVERPASVVKELVENSLDAGAGMISVLARRGGTALLRVTDDGCGMNREDAVMSLERHATSKIRTSDDLASILTKGFRGEALPSIASVARFSLATREAEAITGTEVIVDGGKLISVEDAGMAPGTRIEVRQLFYNVPARRKFLRSEDTEFSHIEQQVRVQALAHPETGFSLTRDERLLFHLPGGAGLLERIQGLSGEDVTGRLLEVTRRTAGPVTVWGFLGEAGLQRSNRALQFTFLNRRPVESPVFQHALRGGFGEALPRGAYPVAFLFVEIDPAEVDVNVHPAKKEVRFRNGAAVQHALAEVITDTLRRGRVTAVAPGFAAREEPEARTPVFLPPPVARWTPEPTQTALSLTERSRETAPTVSEPPRESVSYVPPAFLREPLPNVPPSPLPLPQTTDAPPPQNNKKPGATVPVPEFRVVGLIGSAYAVLESADGLVLLDHRAAWERVLYEESRASRARDAVESQALLAPITVPMSPREFDLLKPQLPALRRLGLGVEEFGPNTVVVDSLPVFYRRDGETAALLSALVNDFRQSGDRSPRHRLDDDLVAAAVARQAARMQPMRAADEAGPLIARLMACEMPYCCPDGRPTLVQLSFQELSRKFGRA